MKTVESVPCACGNGTLSIEVLIFGIWRIEKALDACAACGSSDAQKAREAQAGLKPKDPMAD